MTAIIPKASQPARPDGCFSGGARRRVLVGTFAGLVGFVQKAAAELSCRGKNGYALRQCLREKRQKSAESEEALRDTYLKTRQFEQPGELTTLSNGLQYREMVTGRGEALQPGATCSISYIVYRLSSGAYFKYSSGGTPVYLFSVGYGYEGKDDLDSVYQFSYGDPQAVPLAVTLAMEGMRVGGRRRILVPPKYGWSGEVGPRPDTFGGYRRLEAHKDEPLLFELALKRVQFSPSLSTLPSLPQEPTEPYKLPVPPSPTQR